MKRISKSLFLYYCKIVVRIANVTATRRILPTLTLVNITAQVNVRISFRKVINKVLVEKIAHGKGYYSLS
jgi:hypothetical protein